MFDLSGKHALVTGASGGIGQAIARTLAAQGAAVALSGTRVPALQKLAADLGERAQVFPADLTSADGPRSLVEACLSAFGRIDILVSNAGVTRDALALRMSDEDFQHVLTVNLTAAFRLIRAAMRGMMKARSGRIIGITSVVGTTGNAGQANYAAAKAGLTGMIKSIAQEVAGRGITANCVAPGFIETDMTASLPAETKSAVIKATPAARFGRPDDVSAAVLFLASDEASFVTGQVLHVNGGMVMP